MKVVGLWLAPLVVVSALLSYTRVDASPLRRTYEREFTASDGYVNFGAVLAEFAVASRHLRNGKLDYKGPLDIEKELHVERAKISFARRLRDSFRSRYPERVSEDISVEQEYKVLPYFVSPDVARRLQAEGFDTALNPSKDEIAARDEHQLETLQPRAPHGRRLFEFPILCDSSTGECSTEWVCWSISIALNGLNMEETCNLLEKVQTIADGSWTIDDWLEEIPNFIDLLKDLDGIAGIISTSACAATATDFSAYSQYGDEAVFYYPKAICLDVTVFRGCMLELLLIIGFPLVDEIQQFLPTDVVDILEQIQGLLESIHVGIVNICVSMKQIGLLGDGSLLTFVESWEDLFTLAQGSTTTTKLELLLDVVGQMTSWDLINDYLPAFPAACAKPLATAAQSAYDQVFGPNAVSSDQLPAAICASIGETTALDCLTIIATNIDEIEWMSSALGNGHLHELSEEVVPSLCSVLSDLSNLSPSDIFAQIPLLLRVYKRLSLDLLSSILPGVHDTLIDCAEPFAALAEEAEAALDDTRAMIQLVCSDSVNNNECFVSLSDGIDQIGFAQEVVGQGTLKTVITQTLPGACEITNAVLADDDLSISTILAQLPAIVEWYASVSKIDAFSDYVPAWPEETCSSEVITNLTQDLLEGVEDSSVLPSKLCSLSSGQAQACMLSIGESLENSELVRSLFVSSVTSSGPNATFYALFHEAFPSVCEAVNGADISVEDLVRSIPAVLAVVAALDIVPLRQQFPDIHALLADRVCTAQFEKFGSWIADIIAGNDKNTVNRICSRIGKNQCLIDLSRAVDSIEFVREQIGKGTLELIVDDLVPQTCRDLKSAAGTFSVDTLVESLPSLLSVFDELTAVSVDGSDDADAVYPLQAYLPQIPRDASCRAGFQTIAGDLVNFVYKDDATLGTLMTQMCVTWLDAGYYTCLESLGAEIDQVPLLVDLLGAEGVVQAIPNTLLPSACAILQPELPLMESVALVIEKLPEIISLYADLQPNTLLPGFVKEYLPPFPTENCTNEVVSLLQTHLSEVVGDHSLALQILCQDLEPSEQACLVAIGDGIDQADALQEAVGLSDGFLQSVVQTEIPRACKIIGNELASVDVTNLLTKIPEILNFISSLKETMPTVLAQYIPVIPHETCDASYASVSAKFTANSQPLAVCDFDDQEVECVALLGDAIDDVDMLRELIGGRGLIRYTVTTVRTEACEAIDHISDMALVDLADQIPQAFEILNTLNNFTLLDSYIPDMPSTCEREIPSVASQLALTVQETQGSSTDLEEAIVGTLCSLEEDAKTCLADLGYNLAQVEWIASIVPNTHAIALDLLKLLPLACALFDDQSAFPGADEVLTFLPAAVSLVDSLRDISFVEPYLPDITDDCMGAYGLLAAELSPVGVAGIPSVLCGMPNATKTCFRAISWPAVIPDGVAASVVDTLPTACAAVMSIGDLDFNSILTSIPLILDLVDELHEIDALSAYIPDIDSNCTSLFKTSLVPRFENDGVVEGTCGITSAEQLCVVDLVDRILDVSLIADLASQQLDTDDPDNLKVLVSTLFATLPRACAIVDGVDVLGNVFLALDDMISILEQLREFKAFASVVPSLDASCAAEFRSTLASVQASEAAQTNAVALLPRTVCGVVLGDAALGTCLQNIGAQLDAGPLAGDGDLSIETIVEVFVEKILPLICGVIERVIDDEGTLNITNVVLSLPDIAEIYADAAAAAGPAYLPAFPEQDCSRDVLTSIAEAINSGDVLKVLCAGLTNPDKVCVRSLGSTLDQVSFVSSMMGRSNLISELLGEPMDAACSALSFDTGVDVTSILGHVDTILVAVDAANRLVPSLVADFLPEIPGGECLTVSFPRISVLLADFKVEKLCRMKSADRECVALLGDNLETTPLVRDMLYGDLDVTTTNASLVRSVMEALPLTLCSALDELGAVDFDGVIAAIPHAFTLMRTLYGYPALRAYVPWVPNVCLETVEDMTTRLSSNVDDPVEAMCGLTTPETKCLVGLGASLDATNLTAGVEDLLNATLGLVPTVCDTLQAESIDTSDLLRYLPSLFMLFERVDVVAQSLDLYDVTIGETCHVRLQAMATRLSATGTVDALPAELCNSTSSDFVCMRTASQAIEQLPLVKDTVPEGLLANVLTLMETTVCEVLASSEDTDYLGFVSALPELVAILDQLEEMDIMSSYLPVFSDECKTLFAGSITTKLEEGVALAKEQGLLRISGSLDFSGLTGILCAFNDEEDQCFRDVAHAVVATPMMASLSSSLGEDYTLSEIVESAFRIRERACSLFNELGSLGSASLFFSLRDVLHIIDELQNFPVVSEYVPEFRESCLDPIDDLSDAISSGTSTVSTVCSLNATETGCLVHLAHQLDTISQVRFMFSLFGGEAYESIEAFVRSLLYEVIDPSCALMSDMGVGMEGINLSEFIFKIPDFVDALRTMKTMPFIDELAPQELNDAFEEIDFIGEHIPDGVVEAFIASLDSGCKLFLSEDLDQASFFENEMPVLMRNAGIIAGVQDSCLILSNTTEVCSLGDDCLREYIAKLSIVPLLGKFIPSWASDAVVDLCAVQSGESTMDVFIETHLASIIDSVLDGHECAESEVDTSTPSRVCASLGPACVQELADNLPSLAPDGLDELLVATCSLFASEDGGETVFSLLPYLGSLLDVLAFVLGYPSDTCAVQIKANVLVDDFDAIKFCYGLDSECTTEVVKTMRSLPFVGAYLPTGTDQLIGVLCGVLKDEESLSSLMEHIPTLLDILAEIVLGGHLDLTEACQAEITEYVIDERSGTVNVRNLCVLDDTCTASVIRSLQELPLVGEYVPDTVGEVLQDACVLQGSTDGSNYVEVSEDAESNFMKLLPRILDLLGRVLGDEVAPGDENEANRLLESTINTTQLGCGTMLVSYAAKHNETFSTRDFCSEVTPACVQYATEKLSTLPIVNEFLQPRTGEVLGTTCAIMNATSRKVAMSRIPQLMSSTASLLDLEEGCAAEVEEAAALFKSRGGALDGRTLCAKLPSTGCLESLASKLSELPFAGKYVPAHLDTLIQETCSLLVDEDVESRKSLALYLDEEGPKVLQITAFMAGVDASCANDFALLADVSLTSMCGRPECLSQLASGLETTPLVGDYLPKGLAPLFDGVCAFATQASDWATFAQDTLSKLIYIVAVSVTGDAACAAQLERLALDLVSGSTYLSVPVESLCHISDSCLNTLVSDLTTLPLWGNFLPAETGEVIEGVCEYADLDLDSLSDMDILINTLNKHWSVLMELVLNMVDLEDEDCVASLKSQSTACANEGQCLNAVVSAYQTQLPLVAQLFPANADLAIANVCELARSSKDDIVEVLYKKGGVLDSLILWLPSDALASTDDCASRFATAAALPEAGTPGSWQKVLSCTVGGDCLQPVARKMLKLSSMEVTEAEMALFETVLIDQPCEEGSTTVGDGDGDGNDDGSSSSEDSKGMNISLKALKGASIAAGALLLVTVLVFALNMRRESKIASASRRPDVLSRRVSQSIIPHGLEQDYDAGVGHRDVNAGNDDDEFDASSDGDEDEYDDEPMQLHARRA
ncbi:Hypothetical Protein FCC1311_063882 [Hondaea fermentalgiana]|uniref:Uncharacterized protein n=1 Tax=Hondaea fermentalgiana TaxID=2315210 RepID=A0A2R5GKB4_9STRA|nr:Hypothetical Protein FCC1311_063882 [Hondaea fermentalgiana]|eukprot:GBG30168.1 Hypothetical Protein FCC1311_063882 [Hondaea fermentalgiana]